ncbi:hypothetical protein P152DRAFT_73997 [Eremomyces bilateralis CBS 781.70]|uniref:Uncharacterized protein n=1 Tax=Eremomyces bilateralis CBS 781.70 TaxID=1392243 RepID=A0A6G1FYZ9_9PEZI|nr:uncharacterized protein P152DRAFT_73997 [Eremomyces bilateralis CBS 781.70]KAF1811013.1 hypothetical protein P152DRAFT_73997 [Eremomyces bilateralis CBS 781.70]
MSSSGTLLPMRDYFRSDVFHGRGSVPLKNEIIRFPESHRRIPHGRLIPPPFPAQFIFIAYIFLIHLWRSRRYILTSPTYGISPLEPPPGLANTACQHNDNPPVPFPPFPAPALLPSTRYLMDSSD